MLVKITEDLTAWARGNYIFLKQLSDRVFEVPGYVVFYLQLPDENGKLFDNELFFNNSDEEILTLENSLAEFKYFVFQFGGRFYYCPPVLKKDSFNTPRFKIDFLDFLYLGESQIPPELIFNNLAVHSYYDMLNGSGLENYFKKAKFLNCTHLGLADKNTLAGVLAWQTEADKNNLKPVLGMTIDVAQGYTPGQSELPTTYELKLYVTDYQGWQNLLQINRCINVQYDKFIPDFELLKFQQGLIAVLGRTTDLILDHRADLIKWLRKYTGFHSVYFQVDLSLYEDDGTDLQNLNLIQKYLNEYQSLLPGVLMPEVYYVEREEAPLRDYLRRVAKKGWEFSDDQWFKTWREVAEQINKLCDNEEQTDILMYFLIHGNEELQKACENFRIETGERRFPVYETLGTDVLDLGADNTNFFMNIVIQGFEEKIVKTGKDIKIYKERLNRELAVIKKGGLIDYLLILWDIIAWAKDQDIRVGPARGSVAGCLTAYLMGITEVDSVYHNIMFERFLNEVRIEPEVYYDCTYKDGSSKLIKGNDKEKLADKKIIKKIEVKKFRPDSADVDVDFESRYRDIIKGYISTRFGEMHTCSVGTFQNLKLRSAIKDFGAVKGLKFSYLNYITSFIGNQIEYEFRDFVAYAVQNAELKKFFQTYPDLINVIKFANGQPKTYSVHASAVLVLPKQDREGHEMDLFNWLPVHTIDGLYVSQWEGKWTDIYGALKEDILGLTQLDKFSNILKLIKLNYKKEIDLATINYDDVKVYKLFQAGLNEDVFQFNSNSIKNYTRRLKPTVFSDLVATNALCRPATMEIGAHLDYVLLKNGKKFPKYDYGLKEVTKETYGIMIYQEQMMQATMTLGNFTAVDADRMRTSIKKFDEKTMLTFKEQFIKGALKNDCPEKEAYKIWDKIIAFSGYTFNRAHSVAYSMIGYQAQWLKVHYPLEFWTTALQFAVEEEIPMLMAEIDKLKQGIAIKPPNINHSEISFGCNQDIKTIYWALTKIKGLGIKVVEHIIRERQKNGMFGGYSDFIKRLPKKLVHRGHVEKLILAGAFDEVEKINKITDRLHLLTLHAKTTGSDIMTKFNPVEMTRNYFWFEQQKILTGYGDIDFNALVKQKSPPGYFKKYVNYEALQKLKDYTEVVVAGKFVDLQKIRMKKKASFFFIVKLLANNNLIKCLLWEELSMEREEEILKLTGSYISIEGVTRWDTYAGEMSVYINELNYKKL